MLLYQSLIAPQGLDALMLALSTWNGGVILISHDERFITSVAKEVRLVCLSRSHAVSSFGVIVVGMRRRYRLEVQGRRPGLQGLVSYWDRVSILR